MTVGPLTALSFLTRLPVPGRIDGAGLPRAVPWFPLVGLVVGGGVGAVYVALAQAIPASVAAAVAVAFGLVLTGGFHEDGLADTADGLGGGWDREQRLTIMADPRVGTFGALALVVSVVIRVAALSTLAGVVAVAAAVAAHVLGRTAAVAVLALAPPARAGGLSDAVRDPARRRLVLGSAVVWTAAAAALVGPGPGLAIVAGSLVASLAVVTLARRLLGGVTGDILGAVEQTVELVVLVIATSTWFVDASWLGEPASGAAALSTLPGPPW